MEVSVKSITELAQVAQLLLETHKSSRLFALYGPMGAGKTTFIKALCKHLNISQTVNSPTFSLVNEYTATNGEIIYHFDFYRIKKIAEAYDIGYEEYFYSGNYCFIEWPEKIESLLPEDYIRVEIQIEENDRRIVF